MRFMPPSRPLVPVLVLGILAACAPGVTTPGAAPGAPPGAPATPPLVERDGPLADSIHAYLSSALAPDAPGAAVIVVKDGRTLLRGGYGLADLELGVPVSADHVFRIGSITKQFTAAAILMLAGEGRLSLDDDVGRFLPDYPTGGRRVTVEQLLNHTSGIRSYTGIPAWQPTWRQDLSLDDLIALFQDEPFDFEPGERWAYNNSAYVLLGAIIEAVTGQPYDAFLAARIAGPLGLEATSYDSTYAVIPNRVSGYAPRPGGGWLHAEYLSMTHPHAAGALLSSVDDLARWDAALAAGRVLGTEWLRRAWAPARLPNGRSTGYGHGWMLGELGGHASVEHGGGIHGFNSYALSVPEQRLFVAVLMNRAGAPPSAGELAVTIGRIVLGEPEPQTIAVSAEALDSYLGVYRINEAEDRIITRQGTTLRSRRGEGSVLELTPVAPDTFRFATGTRLAFERGADGRVLRAVTIPRVGPEEAAERIADGLEAKPEAAVSVPEEMMKRYVGEYELAPGFTITVRRSGESLAARRPTDEQREVGRVVMDGSRWLL